jgi:serine/threonine protein kinase
MELLEQLHAALGSGYRIDRELGAAGMSRVFVATDGKLGRQVVVKVLPPQLAAEVSIERFNREILLAASLVHPHIVPLLSAGAFDGVPYYTMPFIESQSLRNRLERDKRLEVSEALELARDALGALDFAHRRNIVHRDIKPGNILVNEGHALVTDFGIARAISESRSTSTSLTQGAGIGTPEYMSPEQWMGEVVDGRTDIYAMGCVLFEMLCGETPFPASAAKPLLTRVLMDPPPLVTTSRADAPQFLDSVVQRALAKSAADRFPTAEDFADALLHRLAVAVARREPSVAVLPFANISGDSSNDYLSDGITDELISSLTRVGGVRVVPRTSAFEFKGQNRDIRQIAGLLGVTHVLEGSIRIAGRRIRATAQLVDAGSGQSLWSERYDRELEDVFAVQDEVTEAIIERLLGEIREDTRFGSTSIPAAAAKRDLVFMEPPEPAPPEDPMLADVREHLGQDYRIDETLGRGGMAVVFKAFETASQRAVALKVLTAKNTDAAKAVERFRLEARLSASLDHPNILPIYRVGSAGPLQFMAMKLVEGRTVAEIVSEQGALPVGAALAILVGAARGLAFAHDKRIVHRDVTGGNVLVDRDGSVYVSDFGIARTMEEVGLTATGMVVGTPYFMSPEALGGQKILPQSDQYSLGILGFQLLTGQVPFDAESMVGVIQHHYMTPVPDMRGARDDVPNDLADIIYCALNKAPEDRFASTRDMLLALEGVLQTEAERSDARFALAKLAMGQVIPGIHTRTLPPLSLTIGAALPSAPAPKKAELSADKGLVKGLEGKFELLQDVGRGALTQVYLARNVTTGEHVAIKTLVPDLAVHDSAVARFTRQAERAASLRHPNLLRIHEVRAMPSYTCIISEYIDGISLADALESVPALQTDTALAILAGAGAGLNHGHTQGLIHTAFTPTNILLSKDGRVIVTDFGIGNIQQPDNLTASGVTMGAPHFMSPEQFAAGHLTPATDQYALGIIAYRLLSGDLPFGGGDMFMMVQRHMTEPVERTLTEYGDVPSALAEAVYRMVAKDAKERFPTVAAALEAGRIASPPDRAAALITAFVRSPASAATRKGRGARRATASVASLVPKSRPRYRKNLFSWIFDLFASKPSPKKPLPTQAERRKALDQAAQSDGAPILLRTLPSPAGAKLTSLATELPPGLAGRSLPPRQPASRKPEGRFSAYDAYLRGRYLINRSAQDWLSHGRGRSRWPAAIAQFDEALRLDPTMTPAYAARAYTRTLVGRFGVEPAKTLRDAAFADVEVAIGRNPRFAEAYLVRGIISTIFDWSADTARDAFTQAIELNANYAEAHLWRGIAASWLEHGTNAAMHIQRALALDPLSTMGKIELALALFAQRDYPSALRAVEEALADKPEHAFGQYARSCILAELGRLDEAHDAITEALRLGGRQIEHVAQLGVVHGRRGAKEDVASVIRELESRRGTIPVESALAVAYAAAGDRESAVRHVGRAIEAREPMLLGALAGPHLDSIRDDARFDELVRGAGLAPVEVTA